LSSNLLSKNLKNKLYINLILAIILYGCETWSFTSREEGMLRVFANPVVRKICGPKRGELTEELRRPHNEELYDLYCSPNIIRLIKSRSMRWAGHVVGKRERRDAYRVLVGRPEGTRSRGKT
jgi:hypothetical protein